MVKGAIRNMIVLRDTESDLYEEAFFLLRDDFDSSFPDHASLMDEASRILKSKQFSLQKSRDPSRLSMLLWYLLGLGSGAGFAFLLMLVG